MPMSDKTSSRAIQSEPSMLGSKGSEVLAALTQAARERILILDGAMGTQIQGLGFGEDHFRGEQFGHCACHQQGNNDLLILTQPEAIEQIHYEYAIAGADIVETNTFSSTAIAQADYGMEGMDYDLNREGSWLLLRAFAHAAYGNCRPPLITLTIRPTHYTPPSS